MNEVGATKVQLMTRALLNVRQAESELFELGVTLATDGDTGKADVIATARAKLATWQARSGGALSEMLKDLIAEERTSGEPEKNTTAEEDEAARPSGRQRRGT